MTDPTPSELAQSAVSAYQKGDLDRAESLAAQVLRSDPNEPTALLIAGAAHGLARRYDEAIELLERADKIAPGNPHILNNLGCTYLRKGDLPRARDCLARAVRAGPNLPDPAYNLGGALIDSNEFEKARAAFMHVLSLAPQHADALAGCARANERLHDIAQAASLAERALAIDPLHPIANMTRADIAMRKDAPGKAADILERLVASTRLTPVNMGAARATLGKAYERLEDYDRAFAAFKAGNDVLYSEYKSAFVGHASPLAPETLERLKQEVSTFNPTHWNADGLRGKDPVFLVGFPRSGTTLLDQILSSHPSVDAIEERDFLTDATRNLIMSANTMAALDQLSVHDINRLRESYWNRLHTAYPDLSNTVAVIDKLPLNIVFLCVIARVFPNAKIILALRDPRDCALSCFQQSFGLTTGMFQFLKLDATARYYDLVMSLTQVSRERFSLATHTIKYEDVISDFRRTIEPLLAFLGCEWDDRVEDYRETAMARRINTPSVRQVIQPIYTSSKGKWRNYEHYLNPALPVLAPWVEAFGYEPNQS